LTSQQPCNSTDLNHAKVKADGDERERFMLLGDVFCGFMPFPQVVSYCANNYLLENLLWLLSFEMSERFNSYKNIQWTTSENGVSVELEHLPSSLLT